MQHLAEHLRKVSHLPIRDILERGATLPTAVENLVLASSVACSAATVAGLDTSPSTWHAWSAVLVVLVTAACGLFDILCASWAIRLYRPKGVRRLLCTLLLVLGWATCVYAPFPLLCRAFPAALSLVVAPRVVFYLALWASAASPVLTVATISRQWWPERFRARVTNAVIAWVFLVAFSFAWLTAFHRSRLPGDPGALCTAAEAVVLGLTAVCIAILAGWEAADPPEDAPIATMDRVIEHEKEWLQIRRSALGLAEGGGGGLPPGAVGLALSGGGIRSATVSLGFLHGLSQPVPGSRRTILEHVDYLSTVSGGGFTGGAFTVRMLDPPVSSDPAATSQPGIELPFDARSVDSWESLATTLRGRGDYVVPGGLGFTAGTVRPLLIFVLGAVVQCAALASLGVAGITWLYNSERSDGFVSRFVHGAAPLLGRFYFSDEFHDETRARVADVGPRMARAAADLLDVPMIQPLYGLNALVIGIACGVATTLAGMLWMFVGTVFLRRAIREQGGWFAARAFVPTAAMAVAYWAIAGSVAVGYVVLGLIACVAVFAYAKRLQRSRVIALAATLVTGQSIAISATQTLQALVKAFAHGLGQLLHTLLLVPVHLDDAMRHSGTVTPLALLIFLTLGFGVSRNHLSLHDFWTGQIRHAYLDPPNGRSNVFLSFASMALWRLRPTKASGEGARGGGPFRGAPLHVISAAANTPGSPDGTNKNRGTVRFEFSPYAIGGPQTGWTDAKAYDDGCTLGGAIAVSAAAVNSQGGNAVPRWARAALALFNLSLGVWSRNPRLSDNALRFRRWGHFWTAYTYKDMIGANSEYDTLLFLSDGGHHENLGLTALVERRCRFVICVDAGYDPGYTCVDLARAATMLRLDEGWTVGVSQRDLADIRPAQVTGSVQERTPKSPILFAPFRRTNAQGRVEQCMVAYVKLALTPNLPLEVLRYADSHPDFPHEPTTEQFFGEAQFEAYRQLGILLAGQLAAELAKSSDWKSAVSDADPSARAA